MSFGKTPSAHPSVGLLATDRGICTASLVHYRVILTAAHCFRDATRAVMYFDSGIRVAVVGSFLLGKGHVGQKDIALGLLAEAVPIPPLEIAGAQPDPSSTLSFHGYGCNSACQGPEGELSYKGAGVKRAATFPAAGFEEDSYRSDLFWICPGDSGGPVLDGSGRVIAVASGIRRYGSGHYHSMVFARVYGIGAVVAVVAASPQKGKVTWR